MTNFIKLTGYYSRCRQDFFTTKFYVNPIQIGSVEKEKSGRYTTISIADRFYEVKESPEEILKKIKATDKNILEAFEKISNCFECILNILAYETNAHTGNLAENFVSFKEILKKIEEAK